MELRNLKTFLRVAELRNFTQAANELGYSQANISAQIKQLETELGCKLFDRVGRLALLNQNGEELLPYARDLVQSSIEIDNLFRQGRQLKGKIKVGMVESVFSYLGQRSVLLYHNELPLVELEMIVDSTYEIKERLQKGSVDIACLIDEEQSKNDWNILLKEKDRVSVIANPNSELAQQAELDIKELQGREFILMEKSAPYMLQFDKCLSEADVSVKPVIRMQSAEKACSMVQSGDFYSALPQYTFKKEAELGKVSVLNIPKLELTQYIQIITHKQKLMLPQIDAFAKIVEDIINS